MRYVTRKSAQIFRTMTLAVTCFQIVAALTIGSTTATAQPKPNEPLIQGWIYSPKFKAPTPYQKFDFKPDLTVKLDLEIPVWQGPTGGKFDLVAYAKASPFTEKWHIEVVKQGPSGNEVALQKFEGLVTGYQFSLPLNADWFKKHGPGKYGAKAYLSQTTSQSKVTGMIAGRGFEIINPPLKMSDQKLGDNVVVEPHQAAPPKPPKRP